MARSPQAASATHAVRIRISPRICLLRCDRAHAAGFLCLDAILDLIAEVTDQALYRPGRRVAKGTNRVTLDLLGHVEQHVDLLDIRLAAHQPVHHPHHPARALATGGALSAALVL